jgi:hypothetical protein
MTGVMRVQVPVPVEMQVEMQVQVQARAGVPVETLVSRKAVEGRSKSTTTWKTI